MNSVNKWADFMGGIFYILVFLTEKLVLQLTVSGKVADVETS